MGNQRKRVLPERLAFCLFLCFLAGLPYCRAVRAKRPPASHAVQFTSAHMPVHPGKSTSAAAVVSGWRNLLRHFTDSQDKIDRRPILFETGVEDDQRVVLTQWAVSSLPGAACRRLPDEAGAGKAKSSPDKGAGKAKRSRRQRRRQAHSLRGAPPA